MAGMAGDLVPFNADNKDVQDEVVRRTTKAGLSHSDGMPTGRVQGRHCKRIVSMPATDIYRDNYRKIFGHS